MVNVSDTPRLRDADILVLEAIMKGNKTKNEIYQIEYKKRTIDSSIQSLIEYRLIKRRRVLGNSRKFYYLPHWENISDLNPEILDFEGVAVC